MRPLVCAIFMGLPACEASARDQWRASLRATPEELAENRREARERAEEAQRLTKARDEAELARRVAKTNEPDQQAQVAALQARAHRETCSESFAQRAADTKKAIAQFETVRLGLKLRCAQLAKSCSIASSGAFACHGVTPDDTRAFGAVCMPWPRVGFVDGSDDCADVDSPSLVVTFEASAEDLAAIRTFKP